jgi:glycosyltransferase involved in cell wall biosynthesis
MVSAARRFRPDIVHGNLARGSWMAGRMGKALGIPVLVTLHNYMRPKYARNVDYFATITEDAADYVKGWGVAPERVRRIPNFSTFPPVESPALFQSEPPTFVALGRFAPMKGFDLLVPAFRIALDRAGPARLILAGAGPDEADLRASVSALGLDAHVEFPGWVEDVMAFLARGDVFVMSSRHEPFGIVVLEAMAAGRVIVSSLAEGPREILDERTAYLAELESVESLADAMVRSISDREQSARKAQAALDLYRNEYRAEQVIPRYIDYYREILQSFADIR